MLFLLKIDYKTTADYRHSIDLFFEGETLLNGKYLPTVQNYLQRCCTWKTKGWHPENHFI